MTNPFAEKSIQAEGLALLVAYLGEDNVWRNNTGAFVVGTGRNRRFIKASRKGISDTLGIVPNSGRLIAVEFKRPYVRGLQSAGKLTKEQLKFLRMVNASGGIGVAIDDVEKLRRILDTLGAEPGARFTIEGERIAPTVPDDPFGDWN